MILACSVFFLALVFIPAVRRVLSWGFGLLFSVALFYSWCLLGKEIYHFHGAVMKAWVFLPLAFGGAFAARKIWARIRSRKPAQS